MSRRDWLLEMLSRHEKSSPLVMCRVENMSSRELDSLSTREARRAYNMAREVAAESYRLIAYVRFQLYMGKVLWAEARPKHVVEDMALLSLQKRYPCFGLVLSTPRSVFMVWPCGEPIERPPGSDIESILEEVVSHIDGQGIWWEDRGDGLWETYYDSQYISSRKNLPLFHKAIPKECMERFPGLAKEKRGVGGRTLDSYIEEG